MEGGEEGIEGKGKERMEVGGGRKGWRGGGGKEKK